MKQVLLRLKRFCTNPAIRFSYLNELGLLKHMKDEDFLCRKFQLVLGRTLDLKHPTTFNEKLQWLKLYDRKPEYKMMVDKYAVRDYIKEKLGEEYLIPLIGVWENPDEIDFGVLPEQFVLKCNHNSGLGMCICRDKSKLDIDKVRKELKKGLVQDYYLTGREWPYKDVPRKIICEKYMSEGNGDIKDYKFLCFNGQVKAILVCAERASKDGVKMTFFDTKWNVMPFKRSCPRIKEDITKPLKLDDMLMYAHKLAEGIPFVRVDFYEIEGKVYFGEITFYPASGFSPFYPEEWDSILGSWIELPIVKA